MQNSEKFQQKARKPTVPSGTSDTGQLSKPLYATPSENQHPASDSSFAARFGRAIVQHGIAAVPSALYHYQGQLDLSAQEVWFTSYVLCFKWDEHLPRVNLSEMEKCVGMTKRSLYRLKDRLCAANYLKVFPMYTETGRQDSSAYDLSGLFERLERLIIADPARHDNPIHSEASDNEDNVSPDRDMSFMARFGRVIARYGVAAIPQALFTYQAALGLSPQQVWFIAYIFSYQWRKAFPYPSIVKMAARTGYSTVQLHEIKASLVKAGYLDIVSRSTQSGGRDSNAYDFSKLFDAIRAQLQCERDQAKISIERDLQPQESLPPLPRPSRRRGRTAARSKNERNPELTLQGDADLLGQGALELIEGGDPQLISEGDSQFIEEDDPKLRADIKRTSLMSVSFSLQERVTPNLHNIESIQKEKKRRKRYDSNHISQEDISGMSETGNTPPSYSPYIASVITDFSSDLNDPEHVISNVTQALRLWKISALEETKFTELLYEAKRRTRQYQGKQGLGTINNKMSYFYMVLRQLIDAQD